MNSPSANTISSREFFRTRVTIWVEALASMARPFHSAVAPAHRFRFDLSLNPPGSAARSPRPFVKCPEDEAQGADVEIVTSSQRGF
jgi:hypothetical protein